MPECELICLRQRVSWQGGNQYCLPRRGVPFGQNQVGVHVMFYARRDIEEGEQLRRQYRYDEHLPSGQSLQEIEDLDLSLADALYSQQGEAAHEAGGESAA